MYFLEIVFMFLLLACSAHASIFGGWTGRCGAMIFIGATVLSNITVRANPDWVSTSYGLFWVDVACLIALFILACNSNRFWPIWAVGFQTVSVLAHFATMLAPDILPKAYQAIEAFWSIPILGVMVAGTAVDWQYDRRV